ncbi:MAG: PilZ domain-containing protein [Candidatus Omnitrophica bacterium]|nr:PilZ domain-containing protein [Candidatus Omnitrophota bacterium]
MFSKHKSEHERRKYIRLDSAFPVQFRLESIQGESLLSGWIQGFTSNISWGGICLSVNNLDSEFALLLKEHKARIALEIEMPLGVYPVKAMAEVAWVKDVKPQSGKYLIGLHYLSIEQPGNKRIMRYARSKRMLLPVGLAIIVIFSIGVVFNSLVNYKLLQTNKELVHQLLCIAQEYSTAKQKIKTISKQREDLQLNIQALELRIRSAQEELLKLNQKAKNLEDKKIDKTPELNKVIEQLTKEKADLEAKLAAVQGKENIVTEELLRLDKKRTILAKANYEKMYHWLKVHQNQRTGLVMSFEGDDQLANWAFTYDQSLVAQAYIYFGDFNSAKKIFDFFLKKAKTKEGLFYNAYYADDFQPAEYIVNSGPNIWLGIAIMHYVKRTQDSTYLILAKNIAAKIMQLQDIDKEGGIRGGFDVGWYSTEHNLDAYAFFNMLYQLTSEKVYKDRADTILLWLVKHAYDSLEVPVKRGRGDATIATDTYAWSIAAVGPQVLKQQGMNPDKIMEFAEQNCAIEVDYTPPQASKTRIKGFDFSAKTHIARGGIISSEWTAQMIIAFKIMADYYYKNNLPAKGHYYSTKADEYLACLEKMIISSPSASGQGEGCLPYSTDDFADTGHGWLTPKGKSTGSLAGTAYTIFAYYNYNPLELKE